MFDVCSELLFIVCCVLSCWLSGVERCVLFVVCVVVRCVSSVCGLLCVFVRHLSCVVCCLMIVACCLVRVVCCVLFFFVLLFVV